MGRGSLISWMPAPVTPTALDAIKLIALVAMIHDHGAKALMGAGDTLFGRIAFPLFFIVFALTLDHIRDRPLTMTHRWLFPALLAQIPFWYLFSRGMPWLEANILLVFIGLAWLAWALWHDRIVIAVVLLVVISLGGWSNSYGYIGPLALLLVIGLCRPGAPTGIQAAGWTMVAALFFWFWTETNGLVLAILALFLTLAALVTAGRLRGRDRLLPAGFLAWAYAGHLLLLGAWVWLFGPWEQGFLLPAL